MALPSDATVHTFPGYPGRDIFRLATYHPQGPLDEFPGQATHPLSDILFLVH
jgi:hypothetical protein